MKAKKMIQAVCPQCGSPCALDRPEPASGVRSFTCAQCGGRMVLRLRTREAPSGRDSASSAAGAAAALLVSPEPSLPEEPPLEESWSGMRGGFAGERDESESSNLLWLTTYGDMMSILLIFFVLMFAISSVHNKEFESVLASLGSALGGREEARPADMLPPPPGPLEEIQRDAQSEKDALSELRTRLEGFIKENLLQDRLLLTEDNEGVALIVQDMTMFDLGRAEIREEVRPYLQRVAAILRDTGNEIVVEGHTDDLPIHSGRFSSNWELSVMRATNVIHYLVAECGMDPSRLSAAGYASYRPRYGQQVSGSEKNRRIEIVIRKKYSDNLRDRLMGAASDRPSAQPSASTPNVTLK